MKVITPAMKLDVHMNRAEVKEGAVVLSGITGIMPCETSMTPKEIFQMMRLVMKPGIIWFLVSSVFRRKN